MAGTAVAATCTSAGKEADQKCSRCQDIIEGTPIKKLGHNYQEVEGTAVEATCTSAGKEADQKCSRCKDEITGNVIKPKAHVEVTIPAVAATCTGNGLTEGKKCSVCETILVPQEVTAPNGHNWNDGELTVEPKCEEAGVIVYTCKTCKDTMPVAVSKTGHTAAKASIENEIPKTCTTDGSYDIVTRCAVCDAILTSKTTFEPATGHALHKTPAVAANYVKAGNREYYTCDTCGGFFSDANAQNPIEEGSWIIKALTPKAQPVSVKVATKTVKAKKLKKKAITVVPLTVSNAKGTVSYKVAGGNAKSKKALKVNTTTGKVTVAKKTKKGSYSLQVTVNATASGNKEYKPFSKTVTITVKVN